MRICSSDRCALSSHAIAGETIRVTIDKLKFDPAQISARVGDTIQ
jgi:plastocyanin